MHIWPCSHPTLIAPIKTHKIGVLENKFKRNDSLIDIPFQQLRLSQFLPITGECKHMFSASFMGKL